MSAIRAGYLALLGVLSFMVGTTSGFATDLHSADLTIRVGSYADLRTTLVPEPAIAWPRDSGPALLSFDGIVETAGTGPRLRLARLEGGADLWRSGRISLGMSGGVVHETIPTSNAEDRLHTQALLRYSARSAGMWLSIATSRPLGGINLGERLANAGGLWFRWKNVGVAATGARTLARTREKHIVTVTYLDPGPDTSYTVYGSEVLERNVFNDEARVGMSVTGLRLDVLPSVGIRRVAMRGTERWIQADATYWIRSGFALVTRVYSSRGPGIGDGDRSITVGARFAPWRKVSEPGRLVPWRKASRPMPPHHEGGVERWELVGGSGGGRMLRIWAPGGSKVYVQGDVTGWLALPLKDQGDGSWTIPLDGDPGPHQLVVRVGEGTWLPLPGAPTEDDDFGGLVSVLIFE